MKPKHSIVLRGYGATSVSQVDARPVIVRRTEGDFVTAVLEGLRAQQSREALGEVPAAERVGGHPHLRQAIHRTFNLVLLEAICDRPGRPRLDPRDVESAGFVVRRVVQADAPTLDEGWQHRGETILGWGPLAYSNESPLPDAAPARRAPQLLDPDPVRRQGRPLTAPPGVHLKLAEIRRRVEPPAEHVVPLFVAPPDVCQAAGRTLLYGVVPTSSSEERSERAAETVDAAVVDTLLPGFLRAGSGLYHPRPGFTTMNGADAAAVDPSSAGGTFGEFVLGLRTLHGVWHVFDSAEGAGLLAALNQIQVEFDAPNAATQPLGDYLAQAADKLLIRVKSGGTLRIPNRWRYPTDGEAQNIRAAATTALDAAHAKNPPSIKRFDEPGALYRLHAFVRVRCDDGCPPEIHWALPSEPFSIAAWWENGGPIHTVALPDVDEESVKKLRPNVAFSLPPKLANLINRSDPKKLRDGDANLDGNPSLGWICSFSLPIITLCAFIVLNIFLGLFHLIFQWLFYIKICLPFPKFSSPPKP